jgi:hypothetical protein
MKPLIATKVFDANCEICKHMSKHDRATFEGFPDVDYQEMDLDDIIANNGNLTKFRLYQLLERHCLSPSYEIDLPVYLVMDRKGAYVSHVQGAKTIKELRAWYSESVSSTLT